jgi:hypothetical protein
LLLPKGSPLPLGLLPKVGELPPLVGDFVAKGVGAPNDDKDPTPAMEDGDFPKEEEPLGGEEPNGIPLDWDKELSKPDDVLPFISLFLPGMDTPDVPLLLDEEFPKPDDVLPFILLFFPGRGEDDPKELTPLDKELPKLAVLPFISLFLGDDPKADPEFFVGVPKFDEPPLCGFPLLEFSLTPGDPNGDPPAFVGLPKPEVPLFCVLPKEELPLPGNPKVDPSPLFAAGLPKLGVGPLGELPNGGDPLVLGEPNEGGPTLVVAPILEDESILGPSFVV